MAIDPSLHSNEPSSESPRQSLFWLMANIAWLFGYPALAIYLDAIFPDALPQHPTLFILGIVANMSCLFSAWYIYDALFKMAAARWPAARSIREVVGPILKAFMFHHRSS